MVLFGAYMCYSQTKVPVSDDNSNDPNDLDIVNSTDTTDADMFEILHAQLDHPPTAIHERGIPDIPPPESSAEVADQFEAGSLPAPSQSSVVVVCFPFGSPSIPISGVHQGSPVDNTRPEESEDSIWAPFHSECDWSIARWAKMHGPTSSAMMELLAIPGV
jgi:hypothetical protein